LNLKWAFRTKGSEEQNNLWEKRNVAGKRPKPFLLKGKASYQHALYYDCAFSAEGR